MPGQPISESRGRSGSDDDLRCSGIEVDAERRSATMRGLDDQDPLPILLLTQVLQTRFENLEKIHQIARLTLG
jgi:hypothetical protein